MKPRIMYIESKGHEITGTGRIGRVTFSDSGRTIYYGGKTFKRGGGSKSNFHDEATGEEYWISGCKRSGEDTLYAGKIEIDEEVREEYWRTIRSQPDRVKVTSFRTVGKYSKRRPK